MQYYIHNIQVEQKQISKKNQIESKLDFKKWSQQKKRIQMPQTFLTLVSCLQQFSHESLSSLNSNLFNSEHRSHHNSARLKPNDKHFSSEYFSHKTTTDNDNIQKKVKIYFLKIKNTLTLNNSNKTFYYQIHFFKIFFTKQKKNFQITRQLQCKQRVNRLLQGLFN